MATQHNCVENNSNTKKSVCFVSGYYLFMGTVIRDDLFDPSRIQFSWACFLLVSVVLPVTTGVLSFYWSRQKWKNHPIAQTLSHYADANSSWHSVASRINIEYRRMDKFTTGTFLRVPEFLHFVIMLQLILLQC